MNKPHMIKKEYHDYVGTPTYVSWYNMKSRCDNPNYTNFEKWGGKGITYPIEWANFLGFLKDMGERPSGTSIDRIDNEKSYSKENCRWATRKEQSRNMSTNRIITYRGVSKILQEWAEETGLYRKTISCRIDRYGWSVEDALTKDKNGEYNEDFIERFNNQ